MPLQGREFFQLSKTGLTCYQAPAPAIIKFVNLVISPLSFGAKKAQSVTFFVRTLHVPVGGRINMVPLYCYCSLVCDRNLGPATLVSRCQ